MFKQYRVVQYGNTFYPQYKYKLFTWCYYTEFNGYQSYTHIYFDTLEKAQEYIKNNEKKIHKVDL